MLALRLPSNILRCFVTLFFVSKAKHMQLLFLESLGGTASESVRHQRGMRCWACPLETLPSVCQAQTLRLSAVLSLRTESCECRQRFGLRSGLQGLSDSHQTCLHQFFSDANGFRCASVSDYESEQFAEVLSDFAPYLSRAVMGTFAGGKLFQNQIIHRKNPFGVVGVWFGAYLRPVLRTPPDIFFLFWQLIIQP